MDDPRAPLSEPSARNASFGSDLERALLFQIRALKLPEPVREARLDQGRRFRWDFSWPGLAVEVDGGTWVGGRHVTGSGVEKDAEKQSLAAIAGYRVIRCTASQVKDGRCLRWIELALA